MSTINLPTYFVSGMENDGTVCWSLPIEDDFDKDGVYRMIYEIQNFKGENKYPTNVDLTFCGEDILQSLIKTFGAFKSNYDGPKENTLFEFRHFCKMGMLVFAYVKIRGHTSSVRKYLRSLNPTLTTKVQKELLREKEWLMDLVRSYFYTKIEKGFNSVKIRDVESMTEKECNQRKKKWLDEGVNWEERTNENPSLNLLFKNEEDFWEGQKKGFISWEGFDSDLSNIQTIRRYNPTLQ